MKNHHEELWWQKDDEIEWKDERIRWALQWFRWRIWWDGRGNWTLGKEKMKTLGTRIYSSRTNSEGRDYSLGRNKNKIYCMFILHQIKLMTSNGFCILLILLEKGLRSDMSQNLRRSSWTTGRIGKNKWIKMIIKEKESWTNHRKNSKMTDEREWITGKN